MSNPEHSQVFAPGLLDGHVVLITGGGTGLGRDSATELARCGARVMLAGRRADVLEEAVQTIAADAGVGEQALAREAGDIRDPREAQRLVAAALERFGALNALVNNAGGQYFTPAEGIVANGWRAVWRLNVEGMLNMAGAAVAAAGGEGGLQRIVNVTLSPHNGMPGMAHSGAARAAVEALTKELAARYADRGVIVTAVAPGPFETDAIAKYPERVRATMDRSTPLGRMGRPQEHAWLIAMLCSPLGAALNGSTITLDGARDNWYGPWPPAELVEEDGGVAQEARGRRAEPPS